MAIGASFKLNSNTRRAALYFDEKSLNHSSLKKMPKYRIKQSSYVVKILSQGNFRCQKAMSYKKQTHDRKILNIRSRDKKQRAQRYIGSTLVNCSAKLSFTIYAEEHKDNNYKYFIRLLIPNRTQHTGHKSNSVTSHYYLGICTQQLNKNSKN